MIHLVYPASEAIAAPWTIGRHLLAALRGAGYEVTQYDWEDRRTLAPAPGDILLGHPHPEPGRVFRNSIAHPGWAKVIGLSPWNGSEEYRRNIENVLPRCNRYFAICGPYWAQRMPPTTEWVLKVWPLDMAIDPDEFPPIKLGFNPVGRRRVLYIGCTLPCKGTEYLAAIAAAMPDVAFGHIGPGRVPLTREYGYGPLSSPEARAVIGEFDFLLCPGRNDANPTTVLEAICWGLIPFATPTCGWGPDIAMPIHASAVDVAAVVLRYYLSAPDDVLLRRLDALRDRLPRYSWPAFCAPILDTIASKK